MDMLRLDLCGGRATLLKAGAVKSRLCRDGAVTALGGQSFPAGILADCPPDISEVKLFDGDTIILTSDGADDDTAELMAHIAAEHSDTDLDSLVQQLGSIALKRRRRDHCDDLTIMAVRVERDKDAVVNVYKR
jgi:Stage II sporulation protein E (SpoIIE).